MSHTILDTSWLDENEAAEALELPLETVHRFYERMAVDPRVPKAFYKGAGIVLLNGFTLSALKGLAQSKQEPQKPAAKRRHAR